MFLTTLGFGGTFATFVVLGNLFSDSITFFVVDLGMVFKLEVCVLVTILDAILDTVGFLWTLRVVGTPITRLDAPPLHL